MVMKYVSKNIFCYSKIKLGSGGEAEGQESRGAEETRGQGGIIEQVSPLSLPSSLSFLHAQCPMPYA